MRKPKDKDKGKRQGKKQGKSKPGVLLSWEEWTDEAMTEYLDAVTEDVAEMLDEQERAFRGRN